MRATRLNPSLEWIDMAADAAFVDTSPLVVHIDFPHYNCVCRRAIWDEGWEDEALKEGLQGLLRSAEAGSRQQ